MMKAMLSEGVSEEREAYAASFLEGADSYRF